MKKDISHLVCQFDSVRILKQGGGKLTLEFGNDSLEQIQKIQQWAMNGDLNLAVAVTKLDNYDSSIDHEIENLEY